MVGVGRRSFSSLLLLALLVSPLRPPNLLSLQAPGSSPCLLVQAASAKMQAEWNGMLQFLAKTKRYNQFLIRLQIASSRTDFIGFAEQNTATFFIPSDSVFTANKRYARAWYNSRCATKSRPTDCYQQLVLFMMFSGKRSIQFLSAVPVGTRMKSVEGDYLQKFKPTGGLPYGLLLGPAVCTHSQPDGCSTTPSTASIREANLYQSPHLLIHGVSALWPTPSVWPNGFN